MEEVFKTINGFTKLREMRKKRVSVVNTNLEIKSNNNTALSYMDELFHPDGANGVFQCEKSVNEKKLRIYNLHIDKKIVLKLGGVIEESWEYIGDCYPQWMGLYKKYKYDSYTAYMELNDTNDSTAHFILENEEEMYIISSIGTYDYKTLCRIVREIGVRKLESEGYIVFHASMVDFDGNGVLVIGNSGSGKTTLALSLCKHEGGRFVANDRVMVKVMPDGTFAAIPFSFPARLNFGTLTTLGLEDKYEDWKLRIPRPNNDSDWDSFNGNKKMHILPMELEKIMNITTCAFSRPIAVVMPSFAKDNECCGIFAETDRDVLTSNCYTPYDPHFVDDWMVQREVSLEWLQHTSDMTVERLLEITNLKMRYTFDKYADLRKEVIHRVRML